MWELARVSDVRREDGGHIVDKERNVTLIAEG